MKMANIRKLKTIMLSPLVKFVLKHPGSMRSWIFVKAMQTFPSKISGSYDEKMGLDGKNTYRALERGLRNIPLVPEKILDICTGTGAAAIEASSVFPVSKIEGVDQAEEMLDIAREKVNNLDIKNIVFTLGNAMELEYDDASFDLVITSNAPVYLCEAARVLKPGGMILIAFSFGGDTFTNLGNDAARYFGGSGIELTDLKIIEEGAYAIGKKEGK